MSLQVERRGDGPDLVLLHGWGMHGGVWDELVPRLAARFRVHVPDLPGHGRSTACGLGSAPGTPPLSRLISTGSTLR